MEKLNIVVISQGIDLRVHVKNQLSGQETVISGYCDFDEAGKLKVQSLFPDAVVCAVKGAVEDSVFAFIQDMLCNSQGFIVILETDEVNVDLVNKAAQYGIRSVLPMDTSPEDFEKAILNVFALETQRSLDTNESKKIRSKVISFFGGKGGTGKTTMSVNVGAALARAGKRVILVDCDLQFGDVATALDLEPKLTIVELVQDRAGITIENINSFAVVHSTGLTVLAAPKSPEMAEYVNAAHIEKIIDVLRPYFEYIILDLPPTFNDISIAAIENCEEVYLVYNTEILSLRNAKQCVNILAQLQQSEKIRMLINKQTNGLIKVKDFEKVFSLPVFGVVPLDVKTATLAINKGQPMMLAQPRSAAAKEFNRIAGKIIELHTGVKMLEDDGKKKRRKKKENDKDKNKEKDKSKAGKAEKK